MKPKKGDREIKVCKATGMPVEMEYVGGHASANGHKGWLCLHTENEVEE